MTAGHSMGKDARNQTISFTVSYFADGALSGAAVTYPFVKALFQILAIGCVGLVMAIVYLTVACTGPGCVFFSLNSLSKATDFVSCETAGFPIIPTSPRQCRAGVRMFWEDVSSPIRIFAPSQGASIDLPLRIVGDAIIGSGNILRFALLDRDGSSLTEVIRHYPTAGSGKFVHFDESLSYDSAYGTGGILDVSLYSKRMKFMTSALIPVRFASIPSQDVKVYFGNAERNPEDAFCDVSYPVVRRLPISEDSLRGAIAELLMGPTELELRQAFFTQIPKETRLQSLDLRKGNLSVNLTGIAVSGSETTCREREMLDQIMRTAKQFRVVTDVTVSFDGSSIPAGKILR